MTSRRGGPASGIVRRKSLRPPRRTAAQDRIYRWLIREREGRTVDAAARALALTTRQAYQACAGLLERGDVVLVGRELRPVRRLA